MNAVTWQQRILHDLKASAPKTAVLGLLFVVGLFFWVPQLVRAFSGSSAGSAAATQTTMTGTQTATATTLALPATLSSPARTTKTLTAIELAQRLKDCPLLQPADLDDFPARPFGVDRDQFPLPVLFAEETEPDQPAVDETAANKPKRLDGLTLKSTIVGTRRRAALVNNRLYQEGQTISWNGLSLRLSSVQKRSVTLTDGESEWQLSLPGPLGDVTQDGEPTNMP